MARIEIGSSRSRVTHCGACLLNSMVYDKNGDAQKTLCAARKNIMILGKEREITSMLK